MKEAKKKKIIVAMSGGVDSSVAAKLLVDQGHEAIGVFLHFWHETRNRADLAFTNAENKCCSVKALMDARRVCNKIGIPLYTMNFSGEFKKEVVDDFLNQYQIGNTPNPCVRCNKFVKLGLLLEKARELGCDFVASGHYAKIKMQKSKCKMTNKNLKLQTSYKLFKGRDENKDQSYFLYTLSQEELGHLLFPLADLTKDEVRKLARKWKLPVSEKSESQEICFIPGKSHNEFLKKYLKLKPGLIKLLNSPLERGFRGVYKPTPHPSREGNYKVIGEHHGLALYTIGQRKGVEIGGTGPYYVARKDVKTNTLFVVEDGNDPALYSHGLVVKNVNWIAGVIPKMPLNCEAVIRYRHKAVKCEVRSKKLELKSKENKYLVKFKKPQRAVTSGQSVVFYKRRLGATNADHSNKKYEHEVLGGGIIV